MKRSLGLHITGAIVVMILTLGCTANTGSTAAAHFLSLWSERPSPPVSGTIGVYVQLSDAPPGTVVLSSREAHVCRPPGSIPLPADPGAESGALPLTCPFEQALSATGGKQLFVIELVPFGGIAAPLLSATLIDGTGATVDAVLRRFYPAGPAVDAGVDSDVGAEDGGSGDAAPPEDDASPEMDAETSPDASGEVGETP